MHFGAKHCQSVNCYMKSKEKKDYESPSTKVIEVEIGCVVCTSGTRDNYGDAIEDAWN